MRFFDPVRSATLAELASLVGGTVERGHEMVVRDICSLDESCPDAIGFVASAKVLRGIEEWPSCVVTTSAFAERVPETVGVLVADKPNVAFAAIGRHLYGAGEPHEPRGIHADAHVDPAAEIEDGVTIAPGAVIETGAKVGRGTSIGSNAHVGENCAVGRDCTIGPNVVLNACLVGNRVRIRAGTVVGDPGFGYVPGPRGIDDVVQIGRVIIQDDVHVGANACIDRGALGDTVIGEGTKIGNMQQIAHNTRIGRHCIIVGNGGIAGSVTIGDGATVAGGVFTIDHAEIGAGATVAGCTMVRGAIPAGETWGGIPARPIADYLRDVAEVNARARKRRAGKE